LLLHRLMEIGHGNPREWPSTTAASLSSGLPYLHRIFFLTSFHSFLTQLREIELTNRWTPLWVPRLVDIDGSLIMLANCTRNSLEICKLELPSSSHPQEPPRLQTVCSLELPALEPYAFVIVSTVDKQWVPTASRNGNGNGGGGRSLPARKRVIPFRSSKVGTIGLFIEHEMRTASARVLPSCWMTIGVPELLSVVASTSGDPAGGDSLSSSRGDGDGDGDGDGGGDGDGHVTRKLPWAKWGPVATRVFPNNYGARLPKPAGPFWITGSSPLVIRDYGTLRARCAEFLAEEEEDRSTSLFGPRVFESTEVLGEHWKKGKLETCLPYRDLVAKDLDYIGVVADREWIIGISVKVRLFYPFTYLRKPESAQGQGSEGLYYTIYHVG
jgi:hypothetical protein